MAVVFYFQFARKRIAEDYVLRIAGQDEFTFKYKICQKNEKGSHLLRVYNLENMNRIMIEMLHEEFDTQNSYGGYIKITRDILDNQLLNNLLGLTKEERQIVSDLVGDTQSGTDRCIHIKGI